MKRYKGTIVLLAAVLVAALIAYALSRQPTTEELREQRARLLPDLAADSVTRLAIADGERRVVCERTDEGWLITHPARARADDWAVEEILERLQAARTQWTISPDDEPDVSPADYGLDPPARTVEVTVGEPRERTWTLLVGTPTGAADALWVQVKGQRRVVAVSRHALAPTDTTVADLRSRSLAPRISTSELAALTVTGYDAETGDPVTVRCERSDGVWEVREPFFDLADADAVHGLARAIYDHSIPAEDFVADDINAEDPAQLAPFGLDQPDVLVTLEARGGGQEFAFARVRADEETTHYAMNRAEASVTRVPEALYNAVRLGPGDLRSPALADVRPKRVEALTIAGPDGEFTLRRRAEEWIIDGTPPAEADASRVDHALRDLTGARVREFVTDRADDLATYGLGEHERMTVTLLDEHGRTLASVAFGRPGEEYTVHARRAGYPPVLRVPKDRFFDPFRRGRLAFLEREILAEPPEQAVRVSLEHEGGRFVCERDSAEAEWRLREPVSGPADQWAARMVVETFGRLRVGAFVETDAADLAPYGLDKPAITATVTYLAPGAAPPERTRTMLIGRETSEPARGSFARLEGDPRVFVLPDFRVDQFRACLASRTICRAPDLAAFAVRRRDDEGRFVRDSRSGDWFHADGSEIDEGLALIVQDIARLLEEFEAERVADYVERRPARYGFDEPYLTVEFDTETTRGMTITVGERTEGGRYVKGPASAFVLVLRDQQVERLGRVLAPAADGP